MRKETGEMERTQRVSGGHAAEKKRSRKRKRPLKHQPGLPPADHRRKRRKSTSQPRRKDVAQKRRPTPSVKRFSKSLGEVVRGFVRALVGRCIMAISGLVFAFAAVVFLQAFSVANQMSDEQLISTLRSPHLLVRVSAEGVTRVIACDCAVPLSAKALTPTVMAAVTAIEDHRFFDHRGIDLVGIARAAIANLSERRFAEGGSTLTQQLVKNVIVGDDRTIERKLAEALLALRIERLFSKKEILGLYLARVSFGTAKGREVRGLRQAANVYFGKSVEELDPIESAVLAAMLKAPNRYNPLRNTAALMERARLVLGRMEKLGHNVSSDHTIMDVERRLSSRVTESRALRHRYFEDLAISEMRRLGLDHGEETYRLVLTMDPRMQIEAERVLHLEVAEVAHLGANRAALVSIGEEGGVRALVGGLDYRRSQFDLATLAWRQGASTMKLVTYLAAIEQGWGMDWTVYDSPSRIVGRPPRNSDGRYLGAVPLWQCFAQSRNVCTTWLAQQIGYDRLSEMANRLGLVRQTASASTLVLGAAETTLMRNTSAYSVIARGGLDMRPHTILRVVSGGGLIHYEKADEEVRRIVSEAHAKRMAELLRLAVTRGTGRNAAYSETSYGKTGTSQENRDAWFVGFSNRGLTTAVWVGPRDGERMNSIYGGTTPARIWRRYNANLSR